MFINIAVTCENILSQKSRLIYKRLFTTKVLNTWKPQERQTTDGKLQVRTWQTGRQTDGKQTNNCHKEF